MFSAGNLFKQLNYRDYYFLLDLLHMHILSVFYVWMGIKGINIDVICFYLTS